MRFLIVSRDENMRGRLADGLRARGFVAEESNGDSLPAGFQPERVLVDVTRAAAPGAAMVPLCRDVVAAYPLATVVVLAPYPSASLMRVALGLGAKHCVPSTEDATKILAAFDEAERPVDIQPKAEVAFATLDEARWSHIGRALETSRGNISGAARLLGIHRQSLQRILRSLRNQEQGRSSSETDPTETTMDGLAS